MIGMAERVAVSHVRVECDNCLDHHGMVIVVYGDGDARTFRVDGGASPKVAVRKVEKAHTRRNFEVVVPEPSLTTVANFVETKCPTCQWSENVVVLVDPDTLDHVVVA